MTSDTVVRGTFLLEIINKVCGTVFPTSCKTRPLYAAHDPPKRAVRGTSLLKSINTVCGTVWHGVRHRMADPSSPRRHVRS